MSVYADGTQTATPGTEHDLATSIPAGKYTGLVRNTNLAAGERLIVRVYEKVLSGGTEAKIRQIATPWPYVLGALEIPAFQIEHAGRVTLQQDGGTGRAFEWSIREL